MNNEQNTLLILSIICNGLIHSGLIRYANYILCRSLNWAMAVKSQLLKCNQV